MDGVADIVVDDLFQRGVSSFDCLPRTRVESCTGLRIQWNRPKECEGDGRVCPIVDVFECMQEYSAYDE